MSVDKKVFINTFDFSNKSNSSTTTLSIAESSNVTYKNNLLKPLNGFEPFFEKYFDNINTSTFKNFLSTLIYVIPYEFYPYFSKNKECRLFVIDKNFKLYEYSSLENQFHYHSIQFSKFPNIFQIEECLYFSSIDDISVVIEKQ